MARGISISPEVKAVLERSSVWGNVVRLPDGNLERPLYAAVDKVLKALGGKWERRAGGHVFAAGIGAELTEALARGVAIDRKKTIELFETPEEIAAMMATRVAQHFEEHNISYPRILEPEAGRGRLIAAMWRSWQEPVDAMIAIDIDAANCEFLREQGDCSLIICTDFLTADAAQYGDVDAVLMNPPFGRNADIAHVTRAFEHWLAPGGILVAVMSPHWTFAQDAASRAFRSLMDSVGGEYQRLPSGSFKAEGTGVETVVVTMRKVPA